MVSKKHKTITQRNYLRGVKVYDNGGRSMDRYTVVLPNGDVYGMSEHPNHPQGFNQYSGTIGMDEGYSIFNIELNNKRTDKSKLSAEVKQAIKERQT